MSLILVVKGKRLSKLNMGDRTRISAVFLARTQRFTINVQILANNRGLTESVRRLTA